MVNDTSWEYWPANRSLGVGWRRGWDLNPRLLSGEPLFESGALSHSATSPSQASISNAISTPDFQPLTFVLLSFCPKKALQRINTFLLKNAMIDL